MQSVLTPTFPSHFRTASSFESLPLWLHACPACCAWPGMLPVAVSHESRAMAPSGPVAARRRARLLDAHAGRRDSLLMPRKRKRTLLYRYDESDPDTPSGDAVDDWRGLFVMKQILLAWQEYERIVASGTALSPEATDDMEAAAERLRDVVNGLQARQAFRAQPIEETYGRREPTGALDAYFLELLMECSVEEDTETYEGDHPGGSSVTTAIYEAHGSDALEELRELHEANLRALCGGNEIPEVP
jgi:hypothetical protein